MQSFNKNPHQRPPQPRDVPALPPTYFKARFLVLCPAHRRQKLLLEACCHTSFYQPSPKCIMHRCSANMEMKNATHGLGGSKIAAIMYVQSSHLFSFNRYWRFAKHKKDFQHAFGMFRTNTTYPPKGNPHSASCVKRTVPPQRTPPPLPFCKPLIFGA